MQKINYELKILINGSRAREYWHNEKNYIEGKEGTEFSLYIKNHSYEKVLAVPTVDGLSVIDGEPADYESRGYIINGHDSLTIKGWRISDKKVAKFYFCDKNNSYASKTNNGKNQGVIGVAFFRQKHEFHNMFSFTEKTTYIDPNIGLDPIKYTDNTRDIPLEKLYDQTSTSWSTSCCSLEAMSNMNSECKSSIGTGWGNDVKSEVVNVSFEREDSPDEVFNIYYGNRHDLSKWGIDIYNNQRPHHISSFPEENRGYCKPPRK